MPLYCVQCALAGTDCFKQPVIRFRLILHASLTFYQGNRARAYITCASARKVYNEI